MISITVVVVCYNEIKTIEPCLQALLDQTYPAKDMEIIVVDNRSNDGTLEWLEGKSASRFDLIDNPERGIAKSRNIGLRQANHDYVAFTDADCIVSCDWLQKLSQGMTYYRQQDRTVAAVGGGNIPYQSGTRLAEAMKISLNSFLGSHSSVQGRQYPADQMVDHLPALNVLYHRQTLLDLNGFDTKFNRIGEDRDLSFRLIEKGYKLYYLKSCPVIHHYADTWMSWLRKMKTYGTGRAWLMKKYPGKHLLFIMPMTLVLLFLFSFVNAIRWLLFCYLVLMLCYAFYLSMINHNIKRCLQVCLFLIATHLAYGVGQWTGFLPGSQKRG